MTPIPFQSVRPEHDARERCAAHPRPSPAIARSDPRWLLAVRVQLLMSGQPCLLPRHRERLEQSAKRLGFMPIHAASIIAIAERSVQRGGLDRHASEEIASIPGPGAGTPSALGMWLWLTVALLVVAAGVIVLARWG